MRSWPISVVAAALLAAGAAGAAYVGKRNETVRKATQLTGGDPSHGPALARRYGCAGCHEIPGVPGAQGLTGPSLRDAAQRIYVAGVLPNSPETLVRFIVDPRAQVPRSAMPITGIDESGARDIVAFLHTQ
jgi:cytochrome c2